MLFSLPSIKSITWSCPCDWWTYLGAPSGLTRRDLTSKPAYNVLMKLIRDEWWTRTTVVADSSGTISFRGFHGHYQLTVDGKTVEFDIASSGTETFEVIVP